LSAYFYDAKGHDREITLDDLPSLKSVKKNQLIWFDVQRGDTETLNRLAKLLDLRSETQTLIAGATKAKGVIAFDGYFMFRTKAAHSRDHEWIDFVISASWLLTVSDHEVAYFRRYRERDRGESLIGNLSPLALAGSLMDWHFEQYQSHASKLQSEIEEIDSAILGGRADRPPLSKLAKMRRTVARLRRHLDFHRPLVDAMLRPDISFVQEERHASYFTILESHFDRAVQALEQTREAMIASFELYATRTSQETNDLVRALTIATVAIGLSAAIAGIFGMNFDIQLFHWGLAGFLLISAVIVSATVAIYMIARLKDWL